ncbi:SRPBCC family protein [Xylanimonas ulmi]|uniref:Polyketide cyclase/dehydrase/lipid transport protein n=1 Tax=Xylanimonas ulmi TaxID=228973 RepID=A0A4Q7M2V4_9MICO|nr:SRPBCC family protein [Xylanibacterium ulmi]RZS60239.1 hypothetical protein EV386_0491 [Xylanibacterium ulmi]
MRHFRLVSHWQVPAPVATVWDELADPAFTWPTWWRGLQAEEVRASGGRTAERWSRVRVRVRSPLGWSLRFGLMLVSVTEPTPGRSPTPGRALLRATGDLSGFGAVVVAPVPGGTRVTLTWTVALTRADAVGRALRACPRPVLAAAHAAVMRAGERGLVRRLRAPEPAVSRSRGAPWPPRRSCAAPP